MECYFISRQTIEFLILKSLAAYPNEASGLLIKKIVRSNGFLQIAFTSSYNNSPTYFYISNKQIINCQLRLNLNEEIVGCFHSHNFGPSKPSTLDSKGIKKEGELWLIYSTKYKSLNLYKWNFGKFIKAKFKIK